VISTNHLYDSQWGQGEDIKEHTFEDNQDWPGLFNNNDFPDVWCPPTPGMGLNYTHNDMLQLSHDNMAFNTGLETPTSGAINLNHLHNAGAPATLNMEEFMASQYQQQPTFYNPQPAFSNIQLPGQHALQYPGPPIYKAMHDQGMGIK